MEIHSQEKNYASLLRNCGSLKNAKLLHSEISRFGQDRRTFIGNLLVQMYGRTGSIEEAVSAFEKIHTKNVFSWNLLLSAFALNGHLLRARELFENIPEKDMVSWTTILVAYAQHGDVYEAKWLFDRMPEKDLVAWNAMISAYAQNGHFKMSVLLYRIMSLEGVKPDELTIISVLDACVLSGALEVGISLHTHIQHCYLSTSLKVCNALINMYSKCKCISDARKIFKSMKVRDFISWTSMIAGFNEVGLPRQALQYFRTMEQEGVKPTSITVIEVLNACAGTGSISDGRQLHLRTVTTGWFNTDSNMRNALLNMYGKCGNLEEARALFDSMPGRDIVTWNTMMASYAQNGVGCEALKLSRLMGLEGIQPDGITVVCIVTACSHAGLVDDGLEFVASVLTDYHVQLTSDHFNCVLDLLGRLGCLKEATSLLRTEVDQVAVRTVIGACKIHGDVILGSDTAAEVVDKESAPYYVMLSNMCTEQALR